MKDKIHFLSKSNSPILLHSRGCLTGLRCAHQYKGNEVDLVLNLSSLQRAITPTSSPISFKGMIKKLFPPI